MKRSTGAFVLLMGGVLFAQDIHFKTRTIRPVSKPDENAGANSASIHRIIQFDHSPGVEDLDDLLKDGLQVVGALPDNAVVVAAPAGVSPSWPGVGPGVRPGVRWIGRLEPRDKLSAALDAASVPNQPGQDILLALVEFHSDVTPGRQDTVAAAEGLTLQRPKVLRPDHAIVEGTPDELKALAVHDEVAYIFPADPGLLTDAGLMPCIGMLTSSGAVGQYANIVHGWDPDADGVAHLSYVFGSVTPKVPALTVQSEVVRALNEWARYANILFQPAASQSAPRSIVVKFVSGSHGDSWPFDGPGGVLAHTFYPVPINAESLAGDMHLDADENWHAGGDVDIYSVALHEAGHAIGLGHSDKVGDVMYPYYRSHLALSDNDIGAAQVLYGALVVPTPSPAPSPTPVTPDPTPAPSTPVTPDPTPDPATPVLPTPLRLVLDSSASSTQSTAIVLTGTLSGGTAPYTVQWQTDHGYSGRALLDGTAWTAREIPLVNGANAITVTAFDAGMLSASLSVATTRAPAPAPPSAPNGPPLTISISSPAAAVSSVSAASLTVAGTASGSTGISRVTWQTAAGATGTAIGTGTWLAQGIPLLVGTNTIILRAWDAQGSSAWAALIAVRH
jgi:hypothetical protein